MGFFRLCFLLAAPSAVEAPHLWPLSALQPATASRCWNARPASACWPNHPREKGTYLQQNKTKKKMFFIVFFHSYWFHHVTAWPTRWGDVRRRRRGRNGRGDYVYFLQLWWFVLKANVKTCFVHHFWTQMIYTLSRTLTWTKTWTIMTWKRRSQ